MLTKGYRLIATAALLAAFGSAAFAGPVTIKGSTFGGTDFSTTGGNGTVNDFLDFAGTTGSPGQLDSGEIVIDITSFSDASGTGIGSTWQLYAVFSGLTTTGGGWNGVNFSTGSGSLNGTVDLYGVSGTTCSFANTDASASISGCSGTPLLLADGTLSSASALSIHGDNGNNNATEAFDLVSNVTSDNAALLPSGLAISLTVDSGSVNDQVNSIAAFDPQLDYGTGSCTNGRESVCTSSSDAVTWNIDPPTPAPEPASLAIFGAALVGLGGWRRAKRG